MSKTAIIALVGAILTGLAFFWLGDTVPDAPSLWFSDMAKLGIGAVAFGALGYLYLTRRRG